jgi:hypothetical protein
VCPCVPSTTNDCVYWTRGIERVGATSPAQSCSWPTSLGYGGPHDEPVAS